MPVHHIHFAHQKNFKVVISDLLTAEGSQTRRQRQARRGFRWLAENFAPRRFAAAFNWEPYRLADACITVTDWEKQLMAYKFGADPKKIFVVPNGVEEVFFQSPKSVRGEWLVCTATITERKRVLELAQAAVAAQTPTWIIGKAYAEDDRYAQQFFALAKANPKIIRYEGAINNRARLAEIYHAARGFVLLSTMESLSLSALEAAASGSPLLLSDLPWARSTFGAAAAYAPVTNSIAKTAGILKIFYASAPALSAPATKLHRWNEVAQELKKIFEQVLA